MKHHDFPTHGDMLLSAFGGGFGFDPFQQAGFAQEIQLPGQFRTQVRESTVALRVSALIAIAHEDVDTPV